MKTAILLCALALMSAPSFSFAADAAPAAPVKTAHVHKTHGKTVAMTKAMRAKIRKACKGKKGADFRACKKDQMESATKAE
jgi:hypothetical protein